jgi:hypothetical protein
MPILPKLGGRRKSTGNELDSPTMVDVPLDKPSFRILERPMAQNPNNRSYDGGVKNMPGMKKSHTTNFENESEDNLFAGLSNRYVLFPSQSRCYNSSLWLLFLKLRHGRPWSAICLGSGMC